MLPVATLVTAVTGLIYLAGSVSYWKHPYFVSSVTIVYKDFQKFCSIPRLSRRVRVINASDQIEPENFEKLGKVRFVRTV